MNSSSRLVVDGTMRRVNTMTGRPGAPTDLNSAASFFAFVASRAGLARVLEAGAVEAHRVHVLGVGDRVERRALAEEGVKGEGAVRPLLAAEN